MTAPVEQSSAVPSIPRCMWTVFALKRAVAWFGLGRTMRWIENRVANTTMRAGSHRGTIEATERVVAMASAFYPGRALCLEQSLTLYYVLRRRGVPVAYCQGVQPQPFQAHAWVEYEGEPVNDVPERVNRFARLHR